MAVFDAVIEQRVREAVSVLSEEADVRAVYVFGSQVEGTPRDFSDIDVAVFVNGLKDWDLRRRAQASARVQKEVGDDVELHFFFSETLANPPKASFALYILREGIPIENLRTRARDRT